MVWIKPKLTSKNRILVEIRKENDFFRLETCKNGIGKSFSSLKGFQIVMKGNNEEEFIIAEEDEENQILDKWLWIERSLLSKFIEQGIDASEKEEVIQFLSLKFESMASPLDDYKSKKDLEFHSLFKIEEKLLVDYDCSLWNTFYRNGRMFLSENFVAFHSSFMENNLTLRFDEITAIRKRSSPLRKNLLYIQTKNSEYYFAGFNSFESSFGMLEQLWKLSMNKILENVQMTKEKMDLRSSISAGTITPSTSSDSLSSSTGISLQLRRELNLNRSVSLNSVNSSENQINSLLDITKSTITRDSLSSKENLLNAKKNLDFRNRFRLPKSEEILEELEGGITNKGLQCKGNILISRHFFSFESQKMINGKSQLSLVIPFRNINNIYKGILPSNPNENLLIVIAEENLFAFNVSDIDSVKNKAEKFWKVDLRVAKDEHSKITEFMKMRKPSEFIDEDQHILLTNWQEYFKICGNPGASMFKREPQFEELILNGIPETHRGALWQMMSGALYKWLVKPDYYQQVQRDHSDKSSLSTEEIDKDLHRSFPQHPEYQKPESFAVLRRVLVAYSWRNPTIGYCQSMNVVTAALLLCMPEEAAFWALSSICEDIVPEYYSKVLIGTMVDQKIIDELLSTLYPQVSQKIISMGISAGDITCPWFMCLFVGYMPFEASCRVLDALFYKGRLVLFQVAMAIFEVAKEVIIALKNVSKLRSKIEEKCFADYKQILKIAFDQGGKNTSVIAQKIEELSQHGQIVQDIQQNYKKAELRELRNDTELSASEIEAIYGKFRSLLPIGTLEDDLEEHSFHSFIDNVIPAWNREEELKLRIWKKYQINNSLSFSDMVSWLSTIFKGSFSDRFEFCTWMFENEGQEGFNEREVIKILRSTVALYGKHFNSSLLMFVKMFFRDLFYPDQMIVVVPPEEDEQDQLGRSRSNSYFNEDDTVEDISLTDEDRNTHLSPYLYSDTDEEFTRQIKRNASGSTGTHVSPRIPPLRRTESTLSAPDSDCESAPNTPVIQSPHITEPEASQVDKLEETPVNEGEKKEEVKEKEIPMISFQVLMEQFVTHPFLSEFISETQKR
eukprot:TRINITY_DN7106_c0_g2_i1.p1 TRINITY_DN7106_c0_g2~~TRINITY_DN7106_c0_g2_i1.p1  ORF type:complete len:1073 (-),score=354.49 TRINITY_DN7106_c0_g2_i1:202-3420(-)